MFIWSALLRWLINTTLSRAISNRQLPKVILPPCSLPIFALGILAVACPSNCQQGEATGSLATGTNSPWLDHLLFPLLWAKPVLNPLEGQALFLKCLSISFLHFLFWNSTITFPSLEEVSQCAKAPLTCSPWWGMCWWLCCLRNIIAAVLLAAMICCTGALAGSQGAFTEWKRSLNPAYLAGRFAKKEPSAPSSCTDGLTHWTQDSHLDVSLKDGWKPRSLSILSLICYKDSFPH